MLTSLPESHVAKVLSLLVSPLATVDEMRHHWMPKGLLDPAEPKLGECSSFLTPELREQLTSWWLINRRGANTPNWDLVSTCTVEGREGLILIEAKAHDSELKRDGKSQGNADNDRQILSAIEGANLALNGIVPGFAITRDSHYQLSNRFAWAWKVASLGEPVILIYLGFLHADEMSRCGTPFASGQEWQSLMMGHAAKLVPEAAWERRLQTGGAPMWSMIRTLDLQWLAAGAPKESTA
jgi:hypothetical protein